MNLILSFFGGGFSVYYYYYYFRIFFTPCMIFALLCPLPPSRNSDPGSPSRHFFSTLPTTVRALHLHRQKTSALSSLVDSRHFKESPVSHNWVWPWSATTVPFIVARVLRSSLPIPRQPRPESAPRWTTILWLRAFIENSERPVQ